MKIYILIVLSFFMHTHNTHAEIVQIPDLSQFESDLENRGKDSLVVFDLDYVVMMPEDDYSRGINPYRKQLWSDLEKKLSKSELQKLHSIMTIDAKWRLVDPRVAHILDGLKKKSIPTIALSTFSTGRYGVIEKREELRFRNLKELGVSFSDLSPFKSNMLMTDLAADDGVPLMQEGVVLTAEINKGVVLEHVLNHYSYKPKEIIFIDDKIKNLHSVEKMCAELNIKFSGYHYIAVELMPEPSINKEKEDYKFHILETEHRWLTEVI